MGTMHRHPSALSCVFVLCLIIALIHRASAQSTLQWHYCLQSIGPSYSVALSGVLTTNATSFSVAAGYGSIPTAAQAYHAIDANGYRIYTDLATGKVTNSSVLGILATNAIGNVNSYIYPGYSPVVDGNGLGLSVVGPVPIGGQLQVTTNPAKLAIWYSGMTANNTPEYLEEVKASTHEVDPIYQNFTIVPYTDSSAPSQCTIDTTLLPELTYWSFCLLTTAPTFTVVLNATLTASGDPIAETGYGTGYVAIGAFGLRTFTNLSTGTSTPIVTKTNIINVLPYHALGNVNMYFFPPPATYPIDGSGFGFLADSYMPIAGQKLTASYNLALWRSGSFYLEEVASATHETTPTWQSLVITQLPTQDTPFTCQLPTSSSSSSTGGSAASSSIAVATSSTGSASPSLRWRYCMTSVGPSYTVALSGVLTTNTTAFNVDAGYGSIPSAAQAYQVTDVTGYRVYTDIATGQVTNSSVLGVLATNAIGSVNSYIYPYSSPVVDGNGLGLSVVGPVPMGGQPLLQQNPSTLAVWYSGMNANNTPIYLEQVKAATPGVTPLYQNFTISPYDSSEASSCSVDTTLLPKLSYFSFCLLTTAPTFTVQLNATITASGGPVTVSGYGTGYLAIGAFGQRVFTNLSTGTSTPIVTKSNIVGVLPQHTIGTSDLIIFPPPATYPIDGTGFGFLADSYMPIAGQPLTPSYNLAVFRSGTLFLEEVATALHETTPTWQSLIVRQLDSPTTPFTCQFPTSSSSSSTGGSDSNNPSSSTTTPAAVTSSTGSSAPTSLQWRYCLQSVGPSYTVSLSGILTTDPTPINVTAGYAALPAAAQAYQATSATGYRIYTDLATAVVTNSTVLGILPLNYIGNVNSYIYPYSSPVVDGDGLGLSMVGPVPIGGQLLVQTNPAALAIWYTGMVNNTPVYLEEVKTSTHEANPIYQNFTIVSYNPSTTYSQCTIDPTLLPKLTYWSFCLLTIGDSYMVQLNATMTASGDPFPVSGYGNGYLTINAWGQRVFYDMSTTNTTIITKTNIIGVLPCHAIGNVDMYFFPAPATYRIDGSGMGFLTDQYNQIAGHPLYPSYTLAIWRSGTFYLEEVTGATHETTPTWQTLTITQLPTKDTPFDCQLPNTSTPTSSTGGSSTGATATATTTTGTTSTSTLTSAAVTSSSSSIMSSSTSAPIQSASSSSSSSSGMIVPDSVDDSESSSSLSGGAIAGIVIGVVVGALLCLLLCFIIVRHQPAKKAPPPNPAWEHYSRSHDEESQHVVEMENIDNAADSTATS